MTDQPGTTRDALEALVEIGDWPVRLVDTAGLREGGDMVERLGIEVAVRHVRGADAVLVCGETEAAVAEAVTRVSALTQAPCLALVTKSDLVPKHPLIANVAGREGRDIVSKSDLMTQVPLPVSVVNGEGLSALVHRLAQLLTMAHPEREGAEPLLTRARHREAVEHARNEAARFLETWMAGAVPAVVATVHLRAAAGALEELIGAVTADDVLDRVFRNFCVGK